MLDIEYKKRSKHVSEALKKAVDDDVDYYSLAIDSIDNLIDSNETYILNSANSALLCVAETVRDPVAIADMGGWNGFEKSCDLFNKKVVKIRTCDGLIDIDYLDDYLNSNTVKSMYITSLSGYNALQDINEISRLCSMHEVVLIIDISPSMGDWSLTNNKCDIIVASCGSPKIVNIENGGILCDVTEKIELNKHLLKTLKADNITCAGIYAEIDNASSILNKTRKYNTLLRNLIKEEIEENDDYYIIHEDDSAINTIIKAPSKKKAKNLAYTIKRQLNISGNHNIISTGPNYNRLKIPCICIETKNIDTSSINEKLIEDLASIVVDSIKKVE